MQLTVKNTEITYEERDKDGGIHHDQGQDGSPTVSKPVGDGARGEDTHKGTALARLEESTLPPSGNGITVADWNTVSLLKRTLRDKVAVEEHVKRFHDL